MLSVQIVGQMDSATTTAVSIHDQIDQQIDIIVWDLGWETAVDNLPDGNEFGIPNLFLVTEL